MIKEASRIDIEDWEQFGGGGNGLSYYNKKDDSVILKLNKASLPKEHTEREYQRSISLYRMGVCCPSVLDIVTDGERYGLIVENIKGKKSFARIISEHPDQLESIAVDFARKAAELHRVRCDNGLFPNYKEEYINLLSECKVLSDKDKRTLKKALDAMEDVGFCIHGDLTPGNIIRAEGKDYWIDFGEVTYGDPDIDMGNMIFDSYHIPPKLVDFLYHISRDQFREFLEIFGREYYGERWGSKELNEKLHNVLLVKAGLSILKRPKSALLYRPLIRGRKLGYKLISGLVGLFLRKI